MEIDDNIDRLAEIIEIKHKDLVDNMKLVSALISNGRASDIVTYTKDAWEIYDNAMELRGMITAYKIILDNEDPEINLWEYEQTVSRCIKVLSINLKKITQRYAQSEQHLRSKSRGVGI